ncbi:MAG: carbon-phosphorus lyase complex subunit PhnI [Desulfosarcinaceae bacterium]|nr:carbon-phosphorus lyase complex subunit PhnI [Desulfosarcinaceae bacterium]
MSYVGVKGGKDAILNAEQLVEYYRCRKGGRPLAVDQIQNQMRLLVDKVMSEGSLYSPEIAAIALKQTEGDPMEAAYLVRAFRSTVSRTCFSVPAKSEEMFCIRRISSSFQDIPWGQVLGPSRDYAQRLIRFDLKDEAHLAVDPPRTDDNAPLDEPVEKVVAYLRRQGLMETPVKDHDQVPYDITRQPMAFPMDRSARLQRLTRGEDGAVLALGYASLRGWGSVHPTLAEVRVGYLPVKIRHPYWRTEVVIGSVMVTEVEAICSFKKVEDPQSGTERYLFTLGYGMVFGHNDRKAIAMSILDRALCADQPTSPVEDQEFVLFHIDNMESQGFISHLKLPHYVSFQSALDRIRSIRDKSNNTRANTPAS